MNLFAFTKYTSVVASVALLCSLYFPVVQAELSNTSAAKISKIAWTSPEGIDSLVANPLWLRNTTISPDGKHIAFTYKGDVYIVSSAGGIAQLFISESGYISNLHWSPQGDAIAMSIRNNNNEDVYIGSIARGTLTRLTWTDKEDIPLGFSSDGSFVLIRSKIIPNSKASFYAVAGYLDQVYKVYVNQDKKIEPFLTYPVYEASLNPDGTKIAYSGENFIEQDYRKHQSVWASPGIFIVDVASDETTRITPLTVNARDPVWGSGKEELFYLSDQSGSLNIWKYDGTTETQLTHHTSHPVRHLSISQTGDMVYSYNGEVYILKKNDTKGHKVEVKIPNTTLQLSNMAVSGAIIDEFALRPNSTEIAVVSWGDIFIIDPEKEAIKRIINTPYEERNIQFSADGKSLIFNSEQNNRWGIYRAYINDADQAFMNLAEITITPVLVSKKFDAIQPKLSPDGKKIAYLRNRDTLYVHTIGTSKDIEIIPSGTNYSYQDGDLSFSWAPDSKHLIADVQEHFETNTEIYLYSIDDPAHPIRVTYNNSQDREGVWSPDGQSIFYMSTVLSSYNADRSPSGGRDIMQAFLSKSAAEGKSHTKDIDLRSTNSQEVHNSIRRITTKTASYNSLLPIPVGDAINIFYTAIETRFNGDSILQGYIVSLQTGEVQNIFTLPYTGIANFKFSASTNSIVFYDGMQLNNFNLQSNANASIPISLSFTISIPDRIESAFNQFWNFSKKKFYDPDMHGVDWDFYGEAYRRFLPHINDPQDLQVILAEMVGELNASHTGTSYNAPNSFISPSLIPSSLGVIYDLEYSGKGFKIDTILPDGPLDTSDSKVQNGDIILAVDKEPIPNVGGIWRLLQGKIQIPTTLTIQRKKKTWIEHVTPISYNDEKVLLQNFWVIKNREYVTAKSKGALGYVYVPEMNEISFRKVVADALGRFRDAKGLIVDIRFNRGGNLHDALATFLTGQKYAYIWPKNTATPKNPDTRDRWYNPSIVLMNASSYSDGSVFPHIYKKLHIGKTVGEPVPGTGTAVWWRESNILPGLVYGMPQVPFRDLNGAYFENVEIEPDVLSVHNHVHIRDGQDVQLDAAIDTLLQDVQ